MILYILGTILIVQTISYFFLNKLMRDSNTPEGRTFLYMIESNIFAKIVTFINSPVYIIIWTYKRLIK